MKKILNNPWVVGVLALAAVAFVAHSLIPARSGASVVAVEESEQVSEEPLAAEAPGGGGDIRDALKELTVASNARDPFSPRAKAAAVLLVAAEKVPLPDIVETIRLTALWTQNGATYALINERIQCVGDKVGGLTVETATQDGVWVTHWKGRDFLALGASFTLTTPALKAAALSLSTES
jgi:hypothetical protein